MSDDLDRRAAIAMGWKARVNKHGYWQVTDALGVRRNCDNVLAVCFDPVSGKRQRKPWTDGVDLPEFSTDMNAAMELVAFARQNRQIDIDPPKKVMRWATFHLQLEDDPVKEQWRADFLRDIGKESFYGMGEALADTAPEAITLAFLELHDSGKLKEPTNE